ncbi:MAG TPA: hypothetical protein ENF87_03255 [Thermoproteales archaeon]|nr:hypothetical protein [Thermoproteales archaeon]
MVSKLLMSSKIFEEIIEIVVKNYPIESCGIMSGIIKGENAHVYCVRELRNILGSKSGFWFDYNEWMEKILECKKLGYEYLGLFHSHARENALLSLSDRHRMLECPGEIWLIIAYKPETKVEYTAWVIEGYDKPLKRLQVEITR